VGAKPVRLLQLPGVCHELIDRPHGAVTSGVGIAEKQVRRERHAVAHAPAEDLRDRHAPRLAQQVQARELDRRGDLRAVVVERRRRVGEQEAQFLEPRRVAADEVRLQRMNGRDRRLPAAAHLAEADEPGIGFDLDDRADETSPMAAVGVAQGRLERHRDGRSADGGDLHIGTRASIASARRINRRASPRGAPGRAATRR
jgi:hypothetical protein